MPLFFFISGFLSFRMMQSWSGNETLSRLGSKVRTMILPALVIGLIYNIMSGEKEVGYILIDDKKMGYWFTFALFNMLIIYYVARWIHARYCKTSLNSFVKHLYLLGLIFFIALSDLSALGKVNNILTLSLTFKFFHFFAFGILCSCNREWFEGIFNKSIKMGINVATFFLLSWIVVWGRGNLDMILTHVSIPTYNITNDILVNITGYCGIITIYGFFRRFGDYFSESNVGKSLQFVGRNTLDVYLLHYFVLINMPTFLYPYIAGTDNILVPLVVGMSVSAIVVAISLLISRVLRLSDHMAYYILGARDVKLGVDKNESKQ